MGSRRVRLTTSPPSVSRLSRWCGTLNVSQPYGPPWPVTRIALFALYSMHAQAHAYTFHVSSSNLSYFPSVAVVFSLVPKLITHVFHRGEILHKKSLEELIAYFPSIWHGPRRERRVEKLSYFWCVFFAAVTFSSSRCLANIGDTYTATQTDERDLWSTPLRWAEMAWCTCNDS
jgi:hypothetical protein